MVEFDPALVEKAARALYNSGLSGDFWDTAHPNTREAWRMKALSALPAVAPDLRAEGRKQAAAALDFDQTCLNCASTIEKSASAYFDGEKAGMVAGAREVLAAVEARATTAYHEGVILAARLVVARIEGEYCTDCEQVHTWAEHRTSGPCPACGEETCPVSDDGEACCDACWREVCEHADIRTFRSHPPHSKCLNCGQVVVQRWVTKTGNE